MDAYGQLKAQLRPGHVYRRASLMALSGSTDRLLQEMVADGTLKKVYQGMYLRPKVSRFGDLPAEPYKLCQAFLKNDNFLLTSPNDFNALGLGTTQLYNCYVVYNHKRNGRFELGGFTFEFRKKSNFPKKATKEYLVVDLLNNLEHLAEVRSDVVSQVKNKMPEFNEKRLRSQVKRFAEEPTKAFFKEVSSAFA
jgi:hypothetical protein